jgi:hypothetical protein
MDSGLKELIEIGKSYGFKAPLDPNCDDLSALSPFKELNEAFVEEYKEDPFFDEDDPIFKSVFSYDEDTYNLLFPERTDAVFRMAGFAYPGERVT